MITDSIQNLDKYLPANYRTKIRKWLDSVNYNTPIGEYEIIKDFIFARILSYHTKPENQCRIEAHNQYIDIQSTITGEEGIQVYDRKKLAVEEPYIADKDIEFYQQTDMPYARVAVKEKYFIMLFPYEAHQPEISFDGKCPQIKKLVIKIREDLYE